ncbi:MAG TPA: hypothetical protein VFO34_04950 [Candidatus Acidoferrales bacterium]|nr:hypothetical protein [Candidatus Acidoferrales bacterium]
MRARWMLGIIATGLCGGVAAAQQGATGTGLETALYCGGIVTSESVHHDAHIISGEASHDEIGWLAGQNVFIDRGADKGVKIGDEFSVIREEHEASPAEWFTGQRMLLRAMGTFYADVARIRVVHVEKKTATAQVVSSCDPVERGDMLLPFEAREMPQLRPFAPMDQFAPATDKPKTAMVATVKRFGEAAGPNSIVYVNLGAAQGVKVGTYFRIFRYQGDGNDIVYQTRGSAYMIYGFGSAPARYAWEDLPRDVIGEGIVLRVSKNAATVLITATRREVSAGDYVEVEK